MKKNFDKGICCKDNEEINSLVKDATASPITEYICGKKKTPVRTDTVSSKYSCRNYSHVNIHVPSRPLAKGLTKRKRKNAVSDFQLRSRLEDILANFSEQLAARKWNSELCFYVSSEERDSLGPYMSVHYLPATAGDEKKKARKKSPKASCNFRGTGWLKGQNS